MTAMGRSAPSPAGAETAATSLGDRSRIVVTGRDPHRNDFVGPTIGVLGASIVGLTLYLFYKGFYLDFPEALRFAAFTSRKPTRSASRAKAPR